MKKLFIAGFATGLLMTGLSFSSQAQARKKVSVDVKGTAVETSRGANTHIKSEAPTTDAVVAQARGNSVCDIYFVNNTGYYVNVYVDGYYKGQLSPWGSGTVVVGEGYTSVYCITAGKTYEWAEKGNCYGSYTFRLRI